MLLALACAQESVPEPDNPLGPLDLVITGGRVIDPETGLDGIRNVGVRDGSIVALTEVPINAAVVLDATGLVVAPDFIALHAHGQAPDSSRYQAMDGVTTALELEVGVYPVAAWYAAREGTALINHGATVSHQGARERAMGSRFVAPDDELTFPSAPLRMRRYTRQHPRRSFRARSS